MKVRDFNLIWELIEQGHGPRKFFGNHIITIYLQDDLYK